METEKTTVFERHPMKMTERESIGEKKTEPKSLRQRWKDHRDQIANRVSGFPLTSGILAMKTVSTERKIRKQGK